MWIAVLLVLVGVVLLYFGAGSLVRGAASIARRLGWSPLVVGLTVVAFGTSTPELVVSVGAALDGRGPIAVGNVVGSNIGNIALILGLSAVIRPVSVQARLLRIDVPLLVGVSAALVLLLRDDRLVLREGVLLLAGLIAYTTSTVILARQESPQVRREFDEGVPPLADRWWVDLARTALGLGLLTAGSRLLVGGAESIADMLGVPEAVVGLTVVAIGTSLPELATSALAAGKGEGDIAVGNVIGSNLFNMLGILGVATVVRPLEPTGMSAVDLTVMVLLAAALFPLMRSGFRITRAEGALLVVVYAGYVTWLIVAGRGVA